MSIIKNNKNINSDILENIITIIKNKVKIPMNNVKETGKYPVISQDRSFIAGYTDVDSFIASSKSDPVILFGDHTTEVKFIDFDFCSGGDGTQIFRTKKDVDIMYLYYLMKNNFIKQDGYKRHFKDLKEKLVSYPNKEEQIKISNFLFNNNLKITNIKNIIEKIEIRNKYYSEKLLSGAFSVKNMKVFEIENNNYIKVKLKDIVDVSIGSTPKEEFYNGDIPWVTISDLGKNDFENTKKKLTKKIKSVEEGSLLISFKLSVGVAKITTREVCTNEAIIRIEPSKLKNNISINYLYHYLPNILLANAGKNAYGANILNTKQINDLDLKIFQDYSEITIFLDKLNEQKNKVEEFLKLEEQRFEWLSNKLLSGEYIIED